MKKNVLYLMILSLTFFTACKKDLTSNDLQSDLGQGIGNDNPGQQIAGGGFEPNELLVKFKKGTSQTGRASALARISGNVKEHILTKAMQRFGDDDGVFLVRTPLAVLEAVQKMKGGAEVVYAEPNYIYTHQEVSNDTYFSRLWGMQSPTSNPGNSFGSQATTAWANGVVGSSGVYVGVIDEGAMYYHEDLGNFGIASEVPGNGNDDDHNGFIDDHYGWDFANNDNTIFDGTSDDHGTHVSGTIGAKGGNSKGVAGVNWKVTLISAKFLGRYGGTTANAIKAVDYITNVKIKNNLNLVATNNSWGGGGFSQGLKDAITRAGEANILFIAAAGNDGANTETTVSYPSGYDNDNIIAVASIASDGALSTFSNYAKTKVDIGAPGSDIYSTLPASSKGKLISSYGSYSGTSMATPHVTGAAALYAASHPGATAPQIKAAILSSAVPTASLQGKCLSNGRLDVNAALTK